MRKSPLWRMLSLVLPAPRRYRHFRVSVPGPRGRHRPERGTRPRRYSDRKASRYSSPRHSRGAVADPRGHARPRGTQPLRDNAWTGANFRRGGYLDHTLRYERAAEFVATVRAIWDSRDDGAIATSQQSPTWARPVTRASDHFRVTITPDAAAQRTRSPGDLPGGRFTDRARLRRGARRRHLPPRRRPANHRPRVAGAGRGGESFASGSRDHGDRTLRLRGHRHLGRRRTRPVGPARCHRRLQPLPLPGPEWARRDRGLAGTRTPGAGRLPQRVDRHHAAQAPRPARTAHPAVLTRLSTTRAAVPLDDGSALSTFRERIRSPTPVPARRASRSDGSGPPLCRPCRSGTSRSSTGCHRRYPRRRRSPPGSDTGCAGSRR